MQVRVDQRRQRPRCFDDVVEAEADLAEHVEVRSEPGRVHDHVDRHRKRLAGAAAGDGDLVTVGTDVVDLKRGELFDLPGLDEPCTLEPSCPRAASPSAASAPRRAVPTFRIAHSSAVPGSSFARAASLMSVFAAVWPAPTTRTRFPANLARSYTEDVGQRVHDPVAEVRGGGEAGGGERGSGTCRCRKCR